MSLIPDKSVLFKPCLGSRCVIIKNESHSGQLVFIYTPGMGWGSRWMSYHWDNLKRRKRMKKVSRCVQRVRRARRKTWPSCSRAHTRLHELNNPHWEKLGKSAEELAESEIFPRGAGKSGPGPTLGKSSSSTSCPTMSGHKNGYKKIKGCRVGGC